jgi:hypothetical protein
VFESKLKTDIGMSIVRLHEVDRDAQAVWRELSAYQMTSTAGSLARESLLNYLTTSKFDASLWKGSYVGYLVNWQDKMREYERLAAPVDHHAPDMKRTLLMQAVSTIKELDSIKSQCQLEVAMGRNMPDFSAYLTLIKSTAAILDQRNLSIRSTRRSNLNDNKVLSANIHDFEDEFENYGSYESHVHDVNEYETVHNIDTHVHELESYRAQQSYHRKKAPSNFRIVSMDRETWHNLSNEDKAKWDTLSQAGKSSIIRDTPAWSGNWKRSHSCQRKACQWESGYRHQSNVCSEHTHYPSQ